MRLPAAAVLALLVSAAGARRLQQPSLPDAAAVDVPPAWGQARVPRQVRQGGRAPGKTRGAPTRPRGPAPAQPRAPGGSWERSGAGGPARRRAGAGPVWQPRGSRGHPPAATLTTHGLGCPLLWATRAQTSPDPPVACTLGHVQRRRRPRRGRRARPRCTGPPSLRPCPAAGPEADPCAPAASRIPPQALVQLAPGATPEDEDRALGRGVAQRVEVVFDGTADGGGKLLLVSFPPAAGPSSAHAALRILEDPAVELVEVRPGWRATACSSRMLHQPPGLPAGPAALPAPGIPHGIPPAHRLHARRPACRRPSCPQRPPASPRARPVSSPCRTASRPLPTPPAAAQHPV